MKRTALQRSLRLVGIVTAASVLSISSSWMPLFRIIASASPSYSVAAGSPVAANTGHATVVSGTTVSGSGTLVVNVYTDGGTLALPDPSTGVTYGNSVSDGVNVTLSGTATDINTALSGMTFTGSSVGAKQIHVTILPQAGAYDPISQHMYTYDGTKRTWSAANTFAATQSIGGATGYLATVTSAAEEDMLTNLSATGWLGGKYVSANDDYEWVTGTENGTSVDDYDYTNWANDQPEENNQGVLQDCMVIDNPDSAPSQWYANQCSPSVAYRYGSYIEYDVSSLVATASQQVNVTATVHNIANCTELQAMNSDFDTYGDTFNLTADIDCQNVPFTPLFWGQNAFGGTFNGQGHSISGLNIETEGGNAGLFSTVVGATLKNVTLASGTGVHAADDGDGSSGYAGALAGEADDSTISNVISHLTVTSDDSEAGGLIGDSESDAGGSTISDSAATGAVSGYGYAGGLIGYANAGSANLTIQHTYATGNVNSGDTYAGGLIGDLEAGDYSDGGTVTIQDVYAWGDVTADDSDSIGGLIGETDTYTTMSAIHISNAYASGTVTGNDYIGGLIGTASYYGNSGPTTLTNVFSAATLDVTSGDPAAYGFIIGDNEDWDDGGPVTGSGVYYDSTNSGIAGWSPAVCAMTNDLNGCSDINGDGTHGGYFLGNHVNAPMNAWNFSTIWTTNSNGLPTFRPTVQDDNDGIASGIEQSAPNMGDGNDDGVADGTQANVTSFVDPVTGHYVTVAAPNACDLSAVSAAAETANTKQDGNYSYPAGMVNYTADCGTNGYTATMHLYFYGQNATNYVLRKYNPIAQMYANVPNATLSNTTIGGQAVIEATYAITDGGALDTDATANGVIVDPVGLALAAGQTATPAGGGLSDTGIDVLAIGGFAALLAGSGVVVRRHKTRQLR